LEGEPTMQTLAITVVMTCQGQEDVSQAFQPVLNNPTDRSLLPAQVVDSCTEAQKKIAHGELKHMPTSWPSQKDQWQMAMHLV